MHIYVTKFGKIRLIASLVKTVVVFSFPQMVSIYIVLRLSILCTNYEHISKVALKLHMNLNSRYPLPAIIIVGMDSRRVTF